MSATAQLATQVFGQAAHIGAFARPHSNIHLYGAIIAIAKRFQLQLVYRHRARFTLHLHTLACQLIQRLPAMFKRGIHRG